MWQKLKAINNYVTQICSLGSQRLWALSSYLFHNDTDFCSKTSFNGTEERWIPNMAPFPLNLFDRNENSLCHPKPSNNAQVNPASFKSCAVSVLWKAGCIQRFHVPVVFRSTLLSNNCPKCLQLSWNVCGCMGQVQPQNSLSPYKLWDPDKEASSTFYSKQE